ncbi:hypothetical protein DID88_004928 [Monilinia fructigena]|uniref:Sm domain-containing protein n=1 Tax=Monilinia fructigena TaxID=38457 RepID=A0A395IQ10_9HELO|nr:hypothetical protein DID88_004928 [Monilinia fructigena]
MVLPLGLLTAAQGHPMLVELKDGETLNGHLVSCDTWMNLTLKEVVQTSPEGDKFTRLPEIYVKGNNIKYLRMPDEIIDLVKDQQQGQQSGYRGRGGNRGDRGGDRGRGDYLVKVRQEKPALVHYDALIAANADAENGSAEVVRTLLEEMKGWELVLIRDFITQFLQVLAIHPDYLLRTQVLEEMKERWYGLSPTGWHNLVVGLLRDRQNEMAMDKFEKCKQSRSRSNHGFNDIFFFRLCEIDELDEALRLLKFRYHKPSTGDAYVLSSTRFICQFIFIMKVPAISGDF